MKIEKKILWMLIGMSLVVALVGALAVNRQHTSAILAATKEAQDVARLAGFLLTSDDPNKFSKSAQETVIKLRETQGRDVVLMDATQLVLADADASEIGKAFTGDPADEVGATILDRHPRTFIERGPTHPTGIEQIVVPVEGESRKVIGAVVLEYTPLYDELMQLT